VTGNTNGEKKTTQPVGKKTRKTCGGCGGKKKQAPEAPRDRMPVITIAHDGVHISGQQTDEPKKIVGNEVLPIEPKDPPEDIDHPRREEPSITRMRVDICKVCKQLVWDENGDDTLEPIKRELDGHIYCGDPENDATLEHPERYGCGCNVAERAKWVQSRCPRGLWGPGKYFDTVVLPIHVVTRHEPLPKTFDFIGPARIADGNAIDCAGIGDTMMQGVIVQALDRINKAQGIQVRVTTVPQRMHWARLAACDRVPVLDLTDEDRRVGEFACHSSPLRMIEMDATCELYGWNRHQFFAKQFDIPFHEIEGWDIKIRNEAREKAAEFLKLPKRDGRPIVAVVPFANSAMRQWPLRCYHELIDRLKKQGVAVYLIDRPRDKKHHVFRIPARRFMSDDEHLIAAVIQQTDVLVGNDSGMAHLAGWVKSKALAICGVTNGDVVFGGWPTVKVMQAPGSCTGCSYYQDNGWKHWCSWGCGLMQDLKPRLVERRVLGLLGGDE